MNYKDKIARAIASKSLTQVEKVTSDLSDMANRKIGNRFVELMHSHLSAGLEPASFLIQGDSTGNADNEWVYETMQWLASKYPKYTFTNRVWNGINQGYDVPTVIQTGTLGDAYIELKGVSGTDYITTPDKANIRVVGDLDVRVKFAMTNWTPSANSILICKWGLTGDRGWALGIAPNGHPYLWWSNDGTALLGGQGSAVECSVSPIIDNGSPIWIRVTLDVDNGAGGNTVKYYTSVDGFAWTQLGIDRITTGVTSIFTSINPLMIGARGAGTSDLATGYFYEAVVLAGIEGKVVASPNVDTQNKIVTSAFTDGESNVWTPSGTSAINGSPGVTIFNASTPGASISYSIDATRFALQTPIEPILAFISYSHNEGTVINYQTTYEGLCNQLLTKYPYCGVVCVTQNPKIAPVDAYAIKAHARRNREIARLTGKNNYGLIDAYREFTSKSDLSLYISTSDGVHPNQAGEDLWRDVAINFLKSTIN
jgi:hypothetical protein